jgi:hypothetical protein
VSARIFVPYTDLHPATVAALEPHRERVELVEVSEEGAYWRLFESLWQRGEDFILVEHDIEVGASTVETFDECPKAWCTATYRWRRREGYRGPADVILWHALGCVRYRAELMAQLPELGDSRWLLSKWPHLGEPPFNYRKVDAIQSELLLHRRRLPHRHAMVTHHQRLGAEATGVEESGGPDAIS